MKALANANGVEMDAADFHGAKVNLHGETRLKRTSADRSPFERWILLRLGQLQVLFLRYNLRLKPIKAKRSDFLKWEKVILIPQLS